MARQKSNVLYKTNFRSSFQKIDDILDIPYLVELQRSSYLRFLQADVEPEKRTPYGLQGVFKSVFPINDYNGTCELHFLGYRLEKPKYDPDECRERGMTYSAPVRIKVRLDQYDITEGETEGQPQRILRFSKEQEAYFGEIPLMTDTGTFIINGTERVIVNQLHRSPGIFFDHDKGRTHSSGKILYSARIIPARGSWLDFDFDHKDIVYVRIDRRRKMFVTVLLKALGFAEEDLLNFFYNFEEVTILQGRKFSKIINFNILQNQRATSTIEIKGEIIVDKNQKYSTSIISKIKKARLKALPITEEILIGKVAAEDVYDPKTGEVLLSCNEEITEGKIDLLINAGIKKFKILFIDGINVGPYLRDTLKLDKTQSADEAMMEVYRKLRPGEPQSIDTVKTFFNNLFFNPDRYDLTKVGRLKLNYKFGMKDEDSNVLTSQDILATVKHLIALKDRRGTIDDIDHLGNRRVRSVGELVENQYRAGLLKMERAIREKMSLTQDMDALMPHDLINAKPVMATMKEFFGSSPLSQFMDQTNPLSEITHKRRLSALGPGGLTRERAGFEVRDVHPTHYGRICPIETPEGPNIGLISSLSSFAKVNEYGFVETPYRIVKQGKVISEIVFLTATEEENYYIAQANSPFDDKGYFKDQFITARYNGEFVRVKPGSIQYMDVSPTQLVSIAAGLIPFLEHDDANRALMGSNMQRQAVPLLRPTAPLVGTGIEKIVARDSGIAVLARYDGTIESVDASRIVVKSVESGMGDVPEIYNLMKFRRSNQNTCYNQIPIVKKGDKVAKGDIIADGPACNKGELSLGQNVVVAFMPWAGYNFEDSIIVSERLVTEDIFTSIHIEEFECVARDTKLGREEITRDIPNVGEEALRNLDDSGIIVIGSHIKPSDILVGKITPKGETQLSPEEKLLRAIFGEKAAEVKDTSLRVPPGVEGVIIDAKVFARKGVEKDKRSRTIEDESRSRLEKDKTDTIKITRSGVYGRIAKILDGYITPGKVSDDRGRVLISKGKKITEEILEGIPKKHWKNIAFGTRKQNEIDKLLTWMAERIDEVQNNFEEKISRLTKGDELPPGVIKTVKVFIAMKRKLSVGDKMAGRHGNKGVVSKVVPMEDMPYLSNGRPVDVILNPLGVPSRMNVGQVLETHLGRAAYELGLKIGEIAEEKKLSASGLRTLLKTIYEDKNSRQVIDESDDTALYRFCRSLRHGVFYKSPVFDGAYESEIKAHMEKAGLDLSGQEVLFDGRSGDPFDQKVTIGVMYIMKLHHLVDDKIHARSIGPYSLVTQQPLGGKAQFGGQRLGEMEVWAIEAYGAAHTLQEFLTVKSDDIQGRTKMYESIVKGDQTLVPGIPESFNVLIKELQSLALNVQLLTDDQQEAQ